MKTVEPLNVEPRTETDCCGSTVQGSKFPALLALVRDLSEHRLRRDPTFRPAWVHRAVRMCPVSTAPETPHLTLGTLEPHGVPGIPKGVVNYE